MTREEALKTATEHVNTMATNARGYQDGVRFPDKIASVEQLARFLMEGEEAVEAAAGPALVLTEAHRDLLVGLLNRQLAAGPSEYDDDAADLLAELGVRS